MLLCVTAPWFAPSPGGGGGRGSRAAANAACGACDHMQSVVKSQPEGQLLLHWKWTE